MEFWGLERVHVTVTRGKGAREIGRRKMLLGRFWEFSPASPPLNQDSVIPKMDSDKISPSLRLIPLFMQWIATPLLWNLTCLTVPCVLVPTPWSPTAPLCIRGSNSAVGRVYLVSNIRLNSSSDSGWLYNKLISASTGSAVWANRWLLHWSSILCSKVKRDHELSTIYVSCGVASLSFYFGWMPFCHSAALARSIPVSLIFSFLFSLPLPSSFWTTKYFTILSGRLK